MQLHILYNFQSSKYSLTIILIYYAIKKKAIHPTPEDNGWTAFTADGSLCAQWEHTILVTEDGIEIISK